MYYNHKGNAQPWFAVTFYEELAKSKDLVLVRGDFTHHIFKLEAQRLLDITMQYHLDSNKYVLVDQFNNSPRDFDITKHIRECP